MSVSNQSSKSVFVLSLLSCYHIIESHQVGPAELG